MKNIMKLITVSIFLSQLAACSGEPSESEIKDAMQKDFAQVVEASKGLLDKESIVVNSIKKIECSEAAQGSEGYQCDVDVDLTNNFVGFHDKSVHSLRFVQSGDGWKVVKN